MWDNQSPPWIKSDRSMCRTAWVLKWQKRLTGFPWKLPRRQAQVLCTGVVRGSRGSRPPRSLAVPGDKRHRAYFRFLHL